MARRVLVSTALITDAQLIIADEPTPGMSLDQALEALKMFREMADEGKAVILITHDIDLAFEFADRVAVFTQALPLKPRPPLISKPVPTRSDTRIPRRFGEPSSKRISADRGLPALCRAFAAGLPVCAALPV